MKAIIEKSEKIQELKKSIENRKQILSIYESVILPTIEKFDGKVYNKRFFTALKEATKDVKLLYINQNQFIKNEFTISFLKSVHNYTEINTLYFGIELNSLERIDFTKTKENKIFNAWLQNYKDSINEIQTVIDNYDNYIKIAERLQKSIDEYAKLPHYFRENTTFENLFYLK